MPRGMSKMSMTDFYKVAREVETRFDAFAKEGLTAEEAAAKLAAEMDLPVTEQHIRRAWKAIGKQWDVPKARTTRVNGKEVLGRLDVVEAALLHLYKELGVKLPPDLISLGEQT